MTPAWDDAGRPVYEAAKRAFDILFAILFIIAAAPMLIAVAGLIKLSSPGPVIFRQRRVGRGGQRFDCYKFRTMYTDAEACLAGDDSLRAKFEKCWKLEHDPRVTPLGRWLRKLSIDEIPQMFNVLRGEMSIVGPRPVQPLELARHFGAAGDKVISVKPGLTSLWVIAGRSQVDYDRRVALEVEYVERRGFALDLLLVLKTVLPVLLRRGAY